MSDGTCVFKISTTAPTGSTTTTLWDSTVALGVGQMRHSPIRRLSFGVENSHTGTLKAYMSVDGGANWYQVEGDKAVAAAAADDISGPYDYLIDTYSDFKLEWVNGGTTQTTWVPICKGNEKREPGT